MENFRKCFLQFDLSKISQNVTYTGDIKREIVFRFGQKRTNWVKVWPKAYKLLLVMPFSTR